MYNKIVEYSSMNEVVEYLEFIQNSFRDSVKNVRV